MKIRVERMKNKLTQAELAEMSGVNRNTISRAENGDYAKLTFEKMESIAKVLGVSTKDLFFDE